MPLGSFTFPNQSRLLVISLLLISWSLFPNLSSNLPSAQAANSIWYVDQNATGANDGSSWLDAYTDLQSALALAQENDQIWIAKGIYRPTSDLSNLTVARTISFAIPNGAQLYGGFAGGEAELDQRDWELHKTILSGDLQGDDITVGGVITSTTGIVGTNSRNVVTILSLTAQNTLLDGLIITGGKSLDSDTAPHSNGAGMRIYETNVTLRNLSFSGNHAKNNGGALYNSFHTQNSKDSSVTISHSSFFGNSAGYAGGAITNTGSQALIKNSSLTISDSTFSGNSADVQGGAIYNIFTKLFISDTSFSKNTAEAGGGISNSTHTTLTLDNTTFTDHSALGGGGGAIWNTGTNNKFSINGGTFSNNITDSEGGAIFNELTLDVHIKDVTFSDNRAEQNGGAFFSLNSKPIFNNVHFINNSAGKNGGAFLNGNDHSSFDNASFIGNSAQNGGALYSFDYSELRLNNVSVIGNTAENGGALYNFHLSNSVITNTVFLGNSASQHGSAIFNHTYSMPSITNSSLSGNSAALGSTIYNFNGSETQIHNSILWGNNGSIQQDAISSTTISFSLLEGCNPGGSWNDACGVNAGGNLADVDPLFVNPIGHTSVPTSTGDLRLQPNSPVINRGSNALNPSTSDLDGKPRVIGAVIDLGAYEALPKVHSDVVGKGNFEYSPILAQYPLSSTITLTATAQAGWSFAGWSGDLNGTSTPTTLLIDDTKQITATFSNDPPSANAGADRSVTAASTVTLNGSASFDADPSQTLTYVWAQSAGTPVTLSDTSAISPTFTAPNTAGVLTFQLIVTDNLGQASTADKVSVTVTNDKPIANAGTDQSVLVATQVTLDGSASNDPDGHTPLAYAWAQSAGTPVTLAGTNTAQPSFTAPSTAGTLTFTLIVTDSLGLGSVADSVTITVTNGEPVADAGADQSVLVGSTVTLDGSASSDPDGHTPLSYSWRQTSGPAVTLAGANTARPSFNAPKVAGMLTFELIVTDSMGLVSVADRVTITVTPYRLYLPLVSS